MTTSQTDRSFLEINGEPSCLEEDGDEVGEFELRHGVKNTKLNCDWLLLHHIYPNCSLAVIQGYREREDESQRQIWEIILGLLTHATK